MAASHEDRNSMFLMDVWDCPVVGELFQTRLQDAVAFPTVDRTEIAISDVSATVEIEKEAYNVPPEGEIDAVSRPRRRILPAIRIASADELYSQLRDSNTHSDYDMIKPHEYGDPKGVAPNEQQPYQVVVSPLVCALCESHCYLSENEVIGMLAGRWDAQSSTMSILLAIPCVATTGKTDVDMDPIAQLSAMSAASALGLQLVGWYHSHPTFDPYPSIIDIKNHKLFQDTFQEAAQPFVGLIVNNQNAESRLQWFSVKKYDKAHGNTADVYLPLSVHVEVGSVRLQRASVPLSLDSVSRGTTTGDKDKEREEGQQTSEIAKASAGEKIGVDGALVSDDAAAATKKSSGKRKGVEPAGKPQGPPDPSSSQASTKNEEVPEISKPAGKRAKKSEAESQAPIPPVAAAEPPEDAADGSAGRSRRARNTSRLSEIMSQLGSDKEFNKGLRKFNQELWQQQKEGKAAKGDVEKKGKVPGDSQNTKELKEESKDKKVGKKAVVKVEEKPSKKTSTVPSAKPSSEQNVTTSSRSRRNDPLYTSFLTSLFHPSLPSSLQARELLGSTLSLPSLALFTLPLLSLGFYYARYVQRTHLVPRELGKGRGRGSGCVTVAALQLKLKRWLCLVQIGSNSQGDGDGAAPSLMSEYLEKLLGFLTQCWLDYDSKTGKIASAKRGELGL